jgi:hypothetical protein
MIPCILQGDDSGGVTITLAEGHNYEGATLVVVFNGVTREFTGLTAGGTVSLAFSAAETAGMPLGAAMVNMRLIGPTGGVETVGNADARIKVTDCVAEVNAGGSFVVTPGGNPLDGVEGLGKRYTGDQLRAKINEVIAKLGGTVAALLLCALPCLGGVTVQTAPLGGIYSDEPVVTNVTVDVSGEIAAAVSGKADKTNTYTKAEIDSRIVELAPTPGDYANVSNRAVSARSYADLSTDTNRWLMVRPNGSAEWLTMDPENDWAWFADDLVLAWDGIAWSCVKGVFPPVVFYGGYGAGLDATSLTFTGGGQTYRFFRGRLALVSELPSVPDLSSYATRGDVSTAATSATNYTDKVADEFVDGQRNVQYAHNSGHADYAVQLYNDGASALYNATDLIVASTNAAEAVVREKSLGGIWDQELGVWWTPVMRNGALRYTATTNVNLNVEN